MTPLEEAQDLLSRPDELVSPKEYRRIIKRLVGIVGQLTEYLDIIVCKKD